MLWQLFKALIALVLLSGIGLVVYAYVGPLVFPTDFEAPVQTVTAPVVLKVE